VCLVYIILCSHTVIYSPTMAPTVPINKSSGRIWTSKPEINSDGLLTTFAFPSPVNSNNGPTAPHPTHLFTRTCFAKTAKPSFCTTDSRGSIWTINPPKNTYKRVSKPSSQGAVSRTLGPATAITYRPSSSSTLLTGHANGVITRIVNTEQTEFRSQVHATPIRHLTSSHNTVLSISQDKAVVWRDDGEKLKVTRSMPGDFRAGRIMPTSRPNSPSSKEIGLLFKDSSIACYDADCFVMTRQFVLPSTEGEAGLTGFGVSGDGR